jgi:hypothetical protein
MSDHGGVRDLLTVRTCCQATVQPCWRAGVILWGLPLDIVGVVCPFDHPYEDSYIRRILSSFDLWADNSCSLTGP